MFPVVTQRVVSHLLILPWLVTWMISVPLFHIHALDAQENRGAGQPVLAHTVFTPDLPGEYAARVIAIPCETSDTGQAIAPHAPRYSEFAITCFEEDGAKRKLGPQPLPLAYAYSPHAPLFEAEPYVRPFRTAPPVLLLASSASPRAPPPLFA